MQYIAPDSPAAAVGLKEHDILQKVNDQLIINFEQLHVLIRSKKAGEKVKLTVLRQGSEKQLDAKLGSRDVASASPAGVHGSAIYGYIPTPDGKKLELSFHPDHPHDLPKEVREHIEEQIKKSKKGGIDFYWHGDKKDQIPHKHEGESKKSEGKKHSSSNSTVTRTVKASGKGELHYEKTNGLETLKAVGPDGAVLFDGPINTPEEKAKSPQRC